MQRPGAAIIVGSLAWIAAIGVGRRVVLDYETTPGLVGPLASSWPEASLLPRPAGRPVLLLFAHPHCPCTRASLGELRAIMEARRSPVDASVVFVRPAGAVEGWERSDLWELAGSIPGVRLAVDPLGVEAARFGAASSGHVALFDGEGRSVFRGGITASRGHPGANGGRDAVVDWLTVGRSGRAESPVFGCPLSGGSVPN